MRRWQQMQLASDQMSPSAAERRQAGQVEQARSRDESYPGQLRHHNPVALDASGLVISMRRLSKRYLALAVLGT